VRTERDGCGVRSVVTNIRADRALGQPFRTGSQIGTLGELCVTREEPCGARLNHTTHPHVKPCRHKGNLFDDRTSLSSHTTASYVVPIRYIYPPSPAPPFFNYLTYLTAWARRVWVSSWYFGGKIFGIAVY